MEEISLKCIFVHSSDIVTRKIEGEILLVPLTNRVAAGEDHLFTLNTTGREIWELFDGSKSLNAIIDILNNKYAHQNDQIEKDVIGLVKELLDRHMLQLIKDIVQGE